MDASPWMTGWSMLPRRTGQYASTTMSFFLQYSTMGLCWQKGCSCGRRLAIVSSDSGMQRGNDSHLDLVDRGRLVASSLDFFQVVHSTVERFGYLAQRQHTSERSTECNALIRNANCSDLSGGFSLKERFVSLQSLFRSR